MKPLHPASLVGALLCLVSTQVSWAQTKPKYGLEAARLSLSHEYFRSHAVPDFWALIPYYVPQQDGKSCSLASVTMVVNAARVHQNLTADDQLATQPEVLKKAAIEDWSKDLGTPGKGVTLDELGRFAEGALRAYGVLPTEVQTLHVDKTPESRKKVHELLSRVGKSDRFFIIANFVQGVFTGDADVGHIAPVGAYDPRKKRVLILDPDREWYEPYWVSEKTFVEGMATQDQQSKKTRGLVFIQLPPVR